MNLPILKPEFLRVGFIAATAIGVACHAWRFLLLPGWEYSTTVFLIALALILVLFAGETSKSNAQALILVYVVGTGILLIGTDFEIVLDGMQFGPATLPVNNKVGVISGLLWLIPVAGSFRLSHRIGGNIYMGAFVGSLLVLAPSLFMILSSESQLLFYWPYTQYSLKPILLWFVAGFFFHITANQIGVKRENPVSTHIYFVYLGYFFVAWILHLVFYSTARPIPL